MDDISRWIEEKYGFVGTTVKLLRSYTNDVYEVTGDKKYLLKIYGDGWRTKSEILWEIELLGFLKAKSVDVAGVIGGVSGEKLFEIGTNGRKRLAVMFEWARGQKPAPPFLTRDYEKLGSSIAKIHKVSDGFESSCERQALDVDYLINNPLVVIEKNCDPKIFSYFKTVADRLEIELKRFEKDGLDIGVVHDDVTFDNLHIDENGEIIFYDFDSGGVGYRALDLQGWAVFDKETVPRQEAFMRGYRTIREISDNDVFASPYLHAANEFWGIGLDLERRMLSKGKAEVNAYLEDKKMVFIEFLEFFSKQQ